MKQTCPNCQTSLEKNQTNCTQCGWVLSLITQDQDEQSEPILSPLEAIEAGNFATALQLLNQSILKADETQLAELYSLRGYVQLKMGNYAKAEDDCNQAIALHHDSPQTLAWRAAALGEQDKWRQAFDDLSAAYEHSPDDGDQYLQLMQAYAESAKEYFQQQIAEEDNDSDQLFFDRAWVYLKSGKLEKAERDFKFTLERNPQHAGAAVGLAELKLDDEEFETALELAEKSFDDDKWNLKALEIHAKAAHALDQPTVCFRSLNKLRKQVGTDSRLAGQCGELRSSLGDYTGAIADFTHAINANHLNHSALLKRGECYAFIRNFALAEQDYIQFIQLNSEDATAYAKLGQVYLMQKRYNQALETFDLALTKDEVCLEALIGRSKAFLEKEQYDRALTECDKALRLDNTRRDVFAIRAQIYFGICEYINAIDDFSRSIEKAPNKQERASQLYRRGVAYYELNQMENAIKDFEEATSLCPNHAGTWIWRGASYARMEQFSDAIISLQKAIAVRPSSAQQYHALGKPVAESAIEHFSHRLQRGHSDSADAYASRALAHAFLGNTDQALSDYNTSLEENPDDPNVLIRRAQMLAQQGDHVSAIEDYTRVIKKEPTNHWSRFCRAMARANINQMDDAKQDILKSIKQAPNHPRYHVLHAEILHRKKDFHKAIRAFDKAIALDPHDPSLYARRGTILNSQRHYLKSIYDFTRSLELLPSQPAVLVARGNVYLKLEQATSARRDFEAALQLNEQTVKAYTGRAASMVAANDPELALIFLTKAFHRFENPRDLAELLLARGKQFYKMARFSPAIGDFTSIIDLLRDQNPAAVSAARFARALATAQQDNTDYAIRDLRKCIQANPNNIAAKQALEYLAHSGKPPKMLQPPSAPMRPTRPKVVEETKELPTTGKDQFETEPLYDSWIVRSEDRREFGPVPKAILNDWFCQGRLVAGMKLLRADWGKWKKISKVYPQLSGKGVIFESIDDVSLLREPSADNSESDSNESA